MPTEWPFWFAFAGSGVLLLLLAWLGSRRRTITPTQLAAGSRATGCGSCGYDLTGLPGQICPECGSDLSVVGRLSPRFHRWAAVPPTARLIIWTVVVAAFAAGMIGVALEQVLPWRQQHHTVASWSLDAWPHAKDDTAPQNHAALVVTVNSWGTQDSRRINGFFLPIDKARWSGASVRTRSYVVPTLPANGTAPTPIVCVIAGEGLTYLAADAQLQNKLTPAASAEVAGPEAATPVHAALLESIRKSGYGGSHGPPEDLAMQLAPEVQAFLLHSSYPPRQQTGDW